VALVEVFAAAAPVTAPMETAVAMATALKTGDMRSPAMRADAVSSAAAAATSKRGLGREVAYQERCHRERGA
jgi:hypothetical protein